jgi:hypothetical protein
MLILPTQMLTVSISVAAVKYWNWQLSVSAHSERSNRAMIKTQIAQ